MSEYSGTSNLEVMTSAVNYNRFLTDRVLEHPKRGDRVLDFGAGIGTFAARVRDAGYAVRCVEIDDRQAAEIARMGIRVDRTLEDVEPHSIDYIYTLNVLEHIEDDVGAMRTLRDRLAPGGRIFVYVPAFDVLYTSMDRKVGHCRRYTIASLSDVVRAAGFRIERTDYADSLGFFATLAYRFAGSETGEINEKAVIAYDRIAFPISRAADRLFGKVFGKNVALLASVPVA